MKTKRYSYMEKKGARKKDQWKNEGFKTFCSLCPRTSWTIRLIIDSPFGQFSRFVTWLICPKLFRFVGGTTRPRYSSQPLRFESEWLLSIGLEKCQDYCSSALYTERRNTLSVGSRATRIASLGWTSVPPRTVRREPFLRTVDFTDCHSSGDDSNSCVQSSFGGYTSLLDIRLCSALFIAFICRPLANSSISQINFRLACFQSRWSLPESIRMSESLTIFRKRLTTNFF